MEKTAAENQENLEYLAPGDISWLQLLGGEPEREDSLSWLELMDTLARTGSPAIDDSTLDHRQEIYSSRRLFYTQLPKIDKSSFKAFYSPNTLPKPDTFIDTMRYLHNQRVDILRICNEFPKAMGFTVSNVEHKMKYYDSIGVAAVEIFNKFPYVIGYSGQTIPQKVELMSSLGIMPSAAINIHPRVLSLPSSAIIDRSEFFKAKGFDFAAIVNKNPRLLTFATENISHKLNAMYAAAKAWGIEDYKSIINNLVEQWPTILTYKAGKIRTLARIASISFSAESLEEVNTSTLSNSMTANLEATLVAYLRGEIAKPSDMYMQSRKYKVLGTQALKKIVAKNKENPVVKVYMRNYKL